MIQLFLSLTLFSTASTAQVNSHHIHSYNYLCVSRDNDGRNPYMLAYRIGNEVNRLEGTGFTSAASCQESLKNVRYVRDGMLICLSRDSDGKDPWILGLLDYVGGLKRMESTITATFADCLDSLKIML